MMSLKHFIVLNQSIFWGFLHETKIPIRLTDSFESESLPSLPKWGNSHLERDDHRYIRTNYATPSAIELGKRNRLLFSWVEFAGWWFVSFRDVIAAFGVYFPLRVNLKADHVYVRQRQHSVIGYDDRSSHDIFRVQRGFQ